MEELALCLGLGLPLVIFVLVFCYKLACEEDNDGYYAVITPKKAGYPVEICIVSNDTLLVEK